MHFYLPPPPTNVNDDSTLKSDKIISNVGCSLWNGVSVKVNNWVMAVILEEESTITTAPKIRHRREPIT